MKYMKIKYIYGGFRIIFQKIKLRDKVKFKSFIQFIDSHVELNISNNSTAIIGYKNYFSKYFYLGVHNGSTFKIGKNNFFNRNVKIECLEGIEIGNNNLFAPNVLIYDHNHVYDAENLMCKAGFSSSKVSIGSNVWIAANCVICEGVKISDNVVVAANSVVISDLESGYLYGGIPAKRIKGIKTNG